MGHGRSYGTSSWSRATVSNIKSHVLCIEINRASPLDEVEKDSEGHAIHSSLSGRRPLKLNFEGDVRALPL